MPAIDNYSPDPSKKRLKISIRYHDSGAVFHQVRYLDEKLSADTISIQEGGVRGPTRHYICEMVGWRELTSEEATPIIESVSRVAL